MLYVQLILKHNWHLHVHMKVNGIIVVNIAAVMKPPPRHFFLGGGGRQRVLHYSSYGENDTTIHLRMRRHTWIGNAFLRGGKWGVGVLLNYRNFLNSWSLWFVISCINSLYGLFPFTGLLFETERGRGFTGCGHRRVW